LRLENAPSNFMGLFENEELIGFVNGTKSSLEYLTHESMDKHEKDEISLCIHSLAIKESHRRNGFGKILLK
jgi:hypothetical protein